MYCLLQNKKPERRARLGADTYADGRANAAIAANTKRGGNESQESESQSVAHRRAQVRRILRAVGLMFHTEREVVGGYCSRALTSSFGAKKLEGGQCYFRGGRDSITPTRQQSSIAYANHPVQGQRKSSKACENYTKNSTNRLVSDSDILLSSPSLPLCPDLTVTDTNSSHERTGSFGASDDLTGDLDDEVFAVEDPAGLFQAETNIEDIGDWDVVDGEVFRRVEVHRHHEVSLRQHASSGHQVARRGARNAAMHERRPRVDGAHTDRTSSSSYEGSCCAEVDRLKHGR